MGFLCPDCQTPEESMEAAVNEVLSARSGWRDATPEGASHALAMDVMDRTERGLRSQLEELRDSRPDASMNVDEFLDAVVG